MHDQNQLHHAAAYSLWCLHVNNYCKMGSTNEAFCFVWVWPELLPMKKNQEALGSYC